MNLADLIDRHAAFSPEKAALRFEGREVAYRAFAERIDAAARALHGTYGIGPGDRVAVLALNHPDTLVLLYACARLGAMLVPLNWRLAVPELLYILGDATPKLLVVEEAFSGVLPPLAKAQPAVRAVGLDHRPSSGASFEDVLATAGTVERPAADMRSPLLVVYTSGTTGRPKGAVLTQEALLANGVMSGHMHAMTSADHVLAVLPFFHVGGLNIQTTPALHHGATVTIHPRFAPAATLAAIAEDRPSLVVLVPATIQALMADPGWAGADLSALRALTTGSMIVPVPLIEALEARGVPVLQVYGSTETCPVAIYTRLGGDHGTRPGSTGLPGLLCEAAIRDEAGGEAPVGEPGEIVVRGPNVFSDYLGDEAATAAALVDGWLRTGDVGSRDAEGYVTVHDRKRNLVISGGENIYPAEVERVLAEHADVADCAVVGRADPRWGEVPVAYVVRRPGGAADEAGLIAHVRASLAAFKAPKAVVFVEDLPRSVLGKVQHFRVREMDRERRP